MAEDDGFRLSEAELASEMSFILAEGELLDNSFNELMLVITYLTGPGGAIKDALISAALEGINSKLGGMRSRLGNAMQDLIKECSEYQKQVEAVDVFIAAG